MRKAARNLGKGMAYVVGAWLLIVILGNLIDLVDGDDEKVDSQPSPSASTTEHPCSGSFTDHSAPTDVHRIPSESGVPAVTTAA